MHTFSVWAPKAQSLRVKIGSEAFEMSRREGDWWSAAVENAGPGTKYFFELDDGQDLPDPRSLFQPEGVNGPSQVIDHSAFRWTDGHWQARPLSSAVIYELHIGTFTPGGTFLSTIERLDHLVDLGVTHIELMPVSEFSGRWGWGYDGVDLYAPHHAYGTPDDLKRLINSCHDKGLAVLLDVVYNHFGPAGNYLSRFGPYLTDAYQTPWGSAVNLDHKDSSEVRRFFFDNALMWLRDYHFDGLRLDAVHAFYDRSAMPFLEDLACEVDTLSAHLGRHLILIAESDLNDLRIVTAREAGGYGIDAQWSDDFHHALHTVLTGEDNGYYEDFGSLDQLGKALQQAYVYDGIHSPHRNRVHGRPVVGLSGHRFLAYSQNHDQIGNRANGERLGCLISLGQYKIAAALVFTSAFVPMLFQGEEFNASSPFQYFTHHEDQDLAHKVSEGRRNEFRSFGWEPEDVPDPQDEETFERCKLRWDERLSGEHKECLDWYKQLIKLRRAQSSLTDGQMGNVEIRCDDEKRWLTVTRGSVDVVCNLAASPQIIPLETDAGQVALCSDPRFRIHAGGVELPGESVAILVEQKTSQTLPRSATAAA